MRTIVKTLILLSAISGLPVLADGQFRASIFLSVYIEAMTPGNQSESSILKACHPVFNEVTGVRQNSPIEYSFHQDGGHLEITVEPI